MNQALVNQRVDFGDTRLPERFWAKVRVAPSGCWEWTANREAQGYGRFSTGSRRDSSIRSKRAYRVSYETLVGPVPSGLCIDHLCRNPPCVNPAHLEAVTQGENNRRGFGFSGLKARQTHCIHGHSLAPGPLVRVRPDGSRVCLLCKNGADWRPRLEGTCKYGHELTPDNTFIRSDGYVLCRICRRRHERATYHRRKAKNTHAPSVNGDSASRHFSRQEVCAGT